MSQRNVLCALLPALMLTSASVHAQAEKASELLLVTRPELAVPGDPELLALAQGVIQHVHQGLYAATAVSEARFSSFLTEGQARGDQRTVFEQLRQLGKLTNRDVTEVAEAIQKRFNHIRPTAFLFVNVLRVQNTTLVQITLHEVQDHFRVSALKTVELSDQGIASFLQRVAYAAQVIASKAPTGAPPDPNITVSPGLEVEAFEPVRLDGSASSDPDMDALAFEWQDEGGRTLGHTRTLTVTPERPGAHTYKLVLRELVAREPQSAQRSIAIQVRARIVADAGPSRIVHGTTKAVLLDAEGSEPKSASAEWRQVIGPPVALYLSDAPRRKMSGENEVLCRSRLCEFVPKVTGEYAFEVTIEDAQHSKSARVSYLVVDPPQAIAGPPELDVAPHVSLELDRNTSYDSVDSHPAMLWTVIGDNRRFAVLSEPRARAPTFNACRSGDYTLRLTVRARRKFNGLELSDVAEDTLMIHVRRPAWTLFSNLDTVFADKIRDQWGVGLQVAVIRRRNLDIGVRWLQALASLQLRGHETLSERFAAGGGLSIAPVATWYMELPFGGTDLSAFFGYRYRVSGKGLDFGATASVRLFEHFSILPDVGLELQLTPAMRADPKAGVGVGYQP